MSWQTITTDLVKTRVAGPMLTALQTAALASGQTDPVVEVIGQVVDEVRGYVAAGGYTLDAAGKVPSKLVGATLAIIRCRIATRLPSKGLLTEEQKKENEDAIRLLGRVADGKYAVEEAVGSVDETIGIAGPRVTSKALKYSRDDAEGF